MSGNDTRTFYDHRTFYIDGAWVDPARPSSRAVIDPATEREIGHISLGGAADVDRAVAAARAAFGDFSRTSRADRLALLGRVVEGYRARYEALAVAISDEMGAPLKLARRAQVGAGLGHLQTIIGVLQGYELERDRGGTRVLMEPVGVCALITPWNWPMNQIACKVAPALAAGCTMVLKPSELAPLDAHIFAEVLDEAGLPPGVFNLVDGDGPGVGAALAAHPGVDMISFTGSTRAGVQVALAAAPTVKRVAQELGGKSANIILPDADLERAVRVGVGACFLNSGQSCDAPTRMLVSRRQHRQALEIAAAAAARVVVGSPRHEATTMGPVVSAAQRERIQGLIAQGIDAGAELVAGGLGPPAGLDRGHYVRPTVFGGVDNSMAIAREEIFGPVLAILPYDDEAQAVAIANDTPYGLAGYVWSEDLDRARRVAGRLRAGQVHINGAGPDFTAPFGGYKRSGNGREWGAHGLAEYLEAKAIIGYDP